MLLVKDSACDQKMSTKGWPGTLESIRDKMDQSAFSPKCKYLSPTCVLLSRNDCEPFVSVIEQLSTDVKWSVKIHISSDEETGRKGPLIHQ